MVGEGKNFRNVFAGRGSEIFYFEIFILVVVGLYRWGRVNSIEVGVGACNFEVKIKIA